MTIETPPRGRTAGRPILATASLHPGRARRSRITADLGFPIAGEGHSSTVSQTRPAYPADRSVRRPPAAGLRRLSFCAGPWQKRLPVIRSDTASLRRVGVILTALPRRLGIGRGLRDRGARQFTTPPADRRESCWRSRSSPGGFEPPSRRSLASHTGRRIGCTPLRGS